MEHGEAKERVWRETEEEARLIRRLLPDARHGGEAHRPNGLHADEAGVHREEG